MSAGKRPKSARGKAFGILNPYGEFWTYDHFPTEALARAYLREFWSTMPDRARDLGAFKVVPVRVTVSALPAKPDVSRGGGE